MDPVAIRNSVQFLERCRHLGIPKRVVIDYHQASRYLLELDYYVREEEDFFKITVLDRIQGFQYYCLK